MTTPYRTATLTSPVDTSPPWWQRAWFRVARGDAAQRWQWARRAIGGRWSPQFVGDFMEVAMLPCDACPCEPEQQFFGGHDEARERWGVCSHRRCLCEVWP
jgi:hypothetical protein